MTRQEMERIWIVDGMCYRIRAQWISKETEALSNQYDKANKQRNGREISRLSRLLQESQSRDIAKALDVIRATKEKI